MKSINIPQNITKIGAKAFAYTNLTSVVVPEAVRELGNSLFCGCTELATVQLPSHITSIPSACFYNCISLKEMPISKNVTSIGDGAFSQTSFTRVEVPSHVTELGMSAFRGCPNLEYVKINGKIKILDNYLFQDCTNLREVVFPESVTQIYGYVFKNCGSLEKINLDNITVISSYAFQNCKKLTSVNLPKIEKFFSEAFSGCTGLTTVTLGSRIKEFSTGDWHGGNTYVFKECENLQDFYCYAETVPKTGGGDFSGAYIEYATLHVPESAIEAYSSVYPWKDFGKIVAIEGTDINAIRCNDSIREGYFTLDGCRLSSPQKGINIIRQSDGTTRKVTVR